MEISNAKDSEKMLNWQHWSRPVRIDVIQIRPRCYIIKCFVTKSNDYKSSCLVIAKSLVLNFKVAKVCSVARGVKSAKG